MNSYLELKRKHEREFNEFPMMFAFSNKQLEEGMRNFGLTIDDTDKIVSIGAGGFIKREDISDFNDMITRQEKEEENAIANDTTGEGYIYQMFDYELGNHEYVITYDVDDTLDALGLTLEEINQDARMKKALKNAIDNQFIN